MRQDTAQDIAGRLYRNLLPFGSGATHKYVLKPAYLDIFIGLFKNYGAKIGVFLK